MTKKKLGIYFFTGFIFWALLVFYMWSMYASQNTLHTQRITEDIRITEIQTEKNLIYASKNLNLLIAKYELVPLSSIDAVSNNLSPLNITETPYFIADGDGNTYDLSGTLHNWKLDLGALTQASTNGYSATPITMPDNTQGSALIVPLSASSFYYLVEYIPVADFLKLIISDIPIPTQYLTLYDEWGTPIYRYSDEVLSDKTLNQLTSGAIDYSFNRKSNPYHKLSNKDNYSYYASLAQPRGWFVGTTTEPTPDLNLIDLYSPNLMILLGLILVLTAIVTLDIVNDHEKKKDTFAVSTVDHLTGLSNSIGMQEAFDKFQETHTMYKYSFVYMDIVAFNRVNTMFGHSMGDSLLKIIGDVIKSYQSCGTHINADYFSFLCKTSDTMLVDFENTLSTTIEAQLGVEYMQLITFKFGVCPIVTAKAIFRNVFENALWALKDAKKLPLQNYVVYDHTLQKNMELQKNIEINMMHALSKEEFLVYIQPQFDMPGECCHRGETLIRWNSEYMGFLPPDKFIPVFESNGFIVETDFYMLTAALDLLQGRIQAGLPPITLAVNQSKVTISFPNYYERLKATIASYNVPLSSIELEITESTLENSWEIIVPLIHSIKKLGFSIAMDDFGSGFSSLNTLRILPIDILKIDKAFLQESDESARSRTIIKNVVNMSKDLDIKVVCEGVETADQLSFLKNIGCDIVQGFYYSKPVPMAEFIASYCDKVL